jgi:hypothetical protein
MFGAYAEKGSHPLSLQDESGTLILLFWGQGSGVDTLFGTLVDVIKVLVHLQQHSSNVYERKQDSMIVVISFQPAIDEVIYFLFVETPYLWGAVVDHDESLLRDVVSHMRERELGGESVDILDAVNQGGYDGEYCLIVPAGFPWWLILNERHALKHRHLMELWQVSISHFLRGRLLLLLLQILLLGLLLQGLGDATRCYMEC